MLSGARKPSTYKVRKKRVLPGSTLQQSLSESLLSVPVLFLENQIAKKFELLGAKPRQGLARKIAEHALSGSSEPFVLETAAPDEQISLTLDDLDIKQVLDALERFNKEQLPVLVSSMANKIATRTLRSLKSRWIDEQTLQMTDLENFRERMRSRWDKPLGQLQMILTMVREWCGNVSNREEAKRKTKLTPTRKVLVRLLVRGCQVADEILCLLENGFADGAMARWRTLHEIGVVASLIQHHGKDLAERYIAHQHVESRRAMEKYLVCSPQLGFRPVSLRDQAKIQKAYDRVLIKYGKEFKSDYGWASFALGNKRPTFADLEEAAGSDAMRSHYQLGNDNIHAGVKSLYVRLGLLGNYQTPLIGRSNAGLTEPGQNAVITIVRLAVTVCCQNPVFDDLVIAEMLIKLRNEIPRSFARVDAQLKSEDKQIWQQCKDKK